jgi:hypothetical protein
MPLKPKINTIADIAIENVLNNFIKIELLIII